MSFRKRVNTSCASDLFTFQINKIVNKSVDGVDVTCTVRPMVDNTELSFESVSPMPTITESIQSGVSLKEVPTDGILDSSDPLDYEMEGIEERVLQTLESLPSDESKPKKTKKSSSNDNNL